MAYIIREIEELTLRRRVSRFVLGKTERVAREMRKRSFVVMRRFVASIALVAAIGLMSAHASAQTVSGLNQQQAALYLACTGVATGGNLSPQITPNALAAEILVNQQLVNQAQSLPALQGLSFIQLSQVMSNSLKTYAKQQLGCTKKCTAAALNLFLTQNPGSCLSIASGFTP